MEHDEALQLAAAFLAASQRDDEPPLAIDTELARVSLMGWSVDRMCPSD
jgi:hypothetical protein